MNTVSIATAVFRQAVAAVQPQHLIPQHIQIEPEGLRIAGKLFHLQKDSRIFVAGAGKAAAAMALALENCRLPYPLEGLVITKYGHTLPLQQIQVMEAGHPRPRQQRRACYPSNDGAPLRRKNPRPGALPALRRRLCPAGRLPSRRQPCRCTGAI